MAGLTSTTLTLSQGLRERNWTSPWYNSRAQPWKVEIYSDAGRFLFPSWPGYRALVTRADGSQARPAPAPGCSAASPPGCSAAPRGGASRGPSVEAGRLRSYYGW